jgi:hypothetical protein
MLNTPKLLAMALLATLVTDTAQAQFGVGQPIHSWDQTIPAASRFILVFSNQAVLDQETGLVWELAPSKNTYTWWNGAPTCLNRVIDGRKGWRVPAIFELTSLIDMNSPRYLPAGHPFKNVDEAFFWSSTRDSNVAPLMWGANTFDGMVNQYVFTAAGLRVWCVRGPSAESTH